MSGFLMIGAYDLEENAGGSMRVKVACCCLDAVVRAFCNSVFGGPGWANFRFKGKGLAVTFVIRPRLRSSSSSRALRSLLRASSKRRLSCSFKER